MIHRQLGKSTLQCSPIGFGAFKVGRNQKAKYPTSYDLPTDEEVDALVDGLLKAGVNYFDTAPAYGISEQRMGRALAGRRSDCVLSTKVGETFDNGVSTYDFSRDSVKRSIERSLINLQTDAVDLIFVHSNGDDLSILQETGVVDCLKQARDAGQTKLIGFSGKTIEGACAALEWADAIMVEYHIDDTSHADVMNEAYQRGIGVIVKKGLASGHLSAADAIRFVLANEAVSSLIVGSLNLEHMRQNIAAATS